jgi:YVTN family beta-propeller protein
VANFESNTVTPIDTATNTAGTVINNVGRSFAVAITPNGQTAYVPNWVSGSVTPLDTATNTPGTAIPVGNPRGIAITPDGQTAYVANFFSKVGGAAGSVSPIDTATNTPGTEIPLRGFPLAIAITPNGQTAYVTVSNPIADSDTVIPIDTATNTPGTAIPVDKGPHSIAITPNGHTAYVGNLDSHTVTPIDTATNTAGTAIHLSGPPAGIAITPNGQTAYVSNGGTAGTGVGNVTPIDIATNTPGTEIPLGGIPVGIAITPNGQTAYVTVSPNTVTPIDTATNTPGTAIPVGPVAGTNSIAIAITPDQAPVAHLSVTPNVAGQVSSFDASASTVAFGTISRYSWNFGDGTTATTTSPTATHVYLTPGTYTASVTETSSGGTSTNQIFTGQTMSQNGGPGAVASQSLTVEPAQGPSAQLAALGHAVQGVGPGTSLADKVAQAQSHLASGDIADVCRVLGGLVHEVKAQSGKHVPPAKAGQLVADAQGIQTELGC